MNIEEKLLKIRKELEEKYSDDKYFPEGLCTLASQIVYSKLKLEFVMGIFKDDHGVCHHHCWNEGNGKVYDITADQFSKEFPSVVILDKNSKEAEKYIESEKFTIHSYV